MERGSANVVFCVATLASILLLPTEVSAQGELQQLRADVRTPSAPKEDKSSSRKTRASCNHSYDCGCYDNDDDNWFGSLFWKAGAFVVAAPIWIPITLAEDDYSYTGYFPEYPYQHNIDGYMMIDPWIPSEPFEYSFQARTEYADNFSGVSRIGTRLLLDTTTRFGIDSEVNYWRESLGIGQHDNLWTGDANLVFRFAQSERMQMRTGLGMNWLADDIGTDLGFNFTYQGDFFPADPWIISTEFDLGTLGDETLVHGRVTAGLHWHRAEVFIGYDYYEVDQTELSGFVSGLRLWL
jgi:hypothetical protein